MPLPGNVQAMRQRARTSGRAILLSSHDLDLALRAADRAWPLPHGGPLQEGRPEDLVLQGASAEALDGDGVEFDVNIGAFRLHEQSGSPVRLIGHGVRAGWTRHALQRAGWHISVSASAPEVEAGEAAWRIHDAFGPREVASVEALLATLAS